MASESTEKGAVSVELDSELEEWLDARATALGVDRETALVRLVATTHAADRDGAADPAELADALAETDLVRTAVASAVDELAADRIESAVDEAVTARLAAAEVADDEDISDRLAGLRADFQTKLEDVRERVVQVKKETDGKAAADHDHEELARVDAVGKRLTDAEEALSDLERHVASLSADVDGLTDAESDDDLGTTVEELRERLKTVAWVVSDLREARESQDGSAALTELKREAAHLDVARAACERCGDGVDIALMTSPACPHCGATVTSVAAASGFFGKPQLLVAAQLESGADS